MGLDFDLAREQEVEDLSGIAEDNNGVLFDDEEEDGQISAKTQPKHAQRDLDDRDEEDVWASLG